MTIEGIKLGCILDVSLVDLTERNGRGRTLEISVEPLENSLENPLVCQKS